MPPNKADMIIGKLDCMAMRFLLSKKKDGTIEAIAGKWYPFMVAIGNSCPPLPNPWAAAITDSVTEAAAPSARPVVMNFDDKGAPIDEKKTILAAQGLEAGQLVTPKKGAHPTRSPTPMPTIR